MSKVERYISREHIKSYLDMIVNGNVRKLDMISSAMGKSYDVVYDAIKFLIDEGFLKNAYIDKGLREVVLPNDDAGECEYCGSPLK